MANMTLMECLQPELVTVERVNYFPRQLLTADDMFTDQEYFMLKLRRHNRFLHGWGTVCGLVVTAAPTTALPWQVQISGGYALGPYGDEIFVAEPVLLDLATCGSGPTDPCEPDMLLGSGATSSAGATVYVAIQYSECFSRPVRVMPSGCGCDETACQNSRIRDSFQIQCLSALPPSYQVVPPGSTLCDYINGRTVPDCPPCPSDPWVVLAAVVLPAFRGVPISDINVDNISVRRQIISTALLQEQVIECCCGPLPTPTPMPQSADLQIAQAFTVITDAATGRAGLRLTITVTNNGPAQALNTTVITNIPLMGQGILNVSPSVPLTRSGNTLQANLGTMNNAQVIALTATFVPTELAFPSGITIVSSASVQSSTFDPNMSNNSSVAQALLPVPAGVSSIIPKDQTVFSLVAPNQIVATFTKQLQGSTVNPQTFKVTGPATVGTVAYDSGSSSATFTFNSPGSNGDYVVTLVGTGANPILDVDGLALDGNGDGLPGGDFTSKFSVQIGQ
jgi:uncharacterized repeat protein (TIGR01451 family)